ncbi:MAG: hypothetical protein IJX77_06355 [Ruminococcus sp.]|nr:hypothetical protein [Ruminococcus sp.]
MKKAHIILTAALLSMSLTGCGAATEEKVSTSSNSIETQAEVTEAETEKSTEAKATEAETEESTEAEATEAETEKPTEAKSAEAEAEPETEKPTEAKAAEAEPEEQDEAEAEIEESPAAEQKEVFALNGPLGRYQGPGEFGNASFAASFAKDDLVQTDDGTLSLTVMIYRYELFSGDDINALKKGDIIWCLGQEVKVDTVETRQDGAVIINGGIENGGRMFKTDDNSVYFEAGMNDRKSYYEIGENTYTLSENFVFTDGSDYGNPVTYTAEEFLALGEGVGFINANTIVETTDGVITAIERVYIP